MAPNIINLDNLAAKFLYYVWLSWDMGSVPDVGRHLADVATIVVLGLVYVVALSLGTVGTAVWKWFGSLTTRRGTTGTVDEDRRPAQ